MKYIVIIFSVILSFKVAKAQEATREKEILSKLGKQNLWYSALAITFDQVKSAYQVNLSKSSLQFLDEILNQTGIDVLNGYPENILWQIPSTNVQFFLGRKYYEEERYKDAIKKLRLVKYGRFKANAKFLLGNIYYLKEKTAEALKHLSKCAKAKRVNQQYNDRFDSPIKNLCLTTIARIMYENKEYDKSLSIYNMIDVQNFLFPSIILEKAWIHYQKGNFNRSLGSLASFQSPILKSFYKPEVEYLNNLNLYKLCQWRDIAAGSKKSKEIIQLQYNKYAKTYNLLYARESNLLKIFRMYKRDLKQQDRGLAFLDGYYMRPGPEGRNRALLNITSEINRLKKLRNPLSRKLMPTLVDMRREIIKSEYIKITEFIRNELKSITKFQRHNFSLNILALSKTREKKFKPKQNSLNKNEKRGGLSNVELTKLQYYWDFNGEFWLDEIGDFSFGLKSACNNRGAK